MLFRSPAAPLLHFIPPPAAQSFNDCWELQNSTFGLLEKFLQRTSRLKAFLSLFIELFLFRLNLETLGFEGHVRPFISKENQGFHVWP